MFLKLATKWIQKRIKYLMGNWPNRNSWKRVANRISLEMIFRERWTRLDYLVGHEQGSKYRMPEQWELAGGAYERCNCHVVGSLQAKEQK